ncbi:MAG: hypothetical protein EAZ57_00510 [Cytophagales bacterium]|nr:MAG: hypothetical protein EAZ67_00620 [Cytophagales bacterium]TAF62272.1 MAG: hypothetical protein EAZ57_00510 [Cytophagales bacterium]
MGIAFRKSGNRIFLEGVQWLFKPFRGLLEVILNNNSVLFQNVGQIYSSILKLSKNLYQI